MNFFAKKILTISALAISMEAFSQFQVQAYASNKESELLGMYDKDFTSNPKWNYFASPSVSYNYDTKDISAELYQNLNYQIAKNWGVSVGTTISNEDVSPLVGLAYLYEKNAFSFSLFPAVNYSFDAKEMGYGFYSLIEYTPKINEKLNFYSMLILQSDFSFNEHLQSSQVVRLGLENAKKFNYGIGSNITEMGGETDANFGLFIGKTF